MSGPPDASSGMTEEMKMILTLIDYLDLKIRATGGSSSNVPVDSSIFGRIPVEYSYIVTPNPPGPP